MPDYDPDANAKGCYDLAISSLRERLEKSKVVIGDCTLYNEDCRFVLPTLHNIDLVFSDPPYGISYKTNYRKIMKTPDAIANDSRPPLEFVPYMVKPIKVSGAIYLCTRSDVQYQWALALKDAKCRVKTPIIWDKGNHTAGDLDGDYGSQTEVILFAHKGRHLLRNGRDVNLWRHPRDPAGDHPTPKPMALCARAIRNSSDIGDIVLDPFMGTGASGLAALRLGRKYIGIEMDKKYFDIACQRITDAYKQGDLFVPSPSSVKPEQIDLLE